MMVRLVRSAGFPARFLTLARETFEASVAIQYDAPWARENRGAVSSRRRNDAA
jgi:hypothetical protein